MTNLLRAAALAAALLGAPAAAQTAPAALAAPTWDARLLPAPAAAREDAALPAAVRPRPVRGALLIVVGAATMWATKKAEGGDGEEGVPFIPLLSGTMGALTFWYGVYEMVQGG